MKTVDIRANYDAAIKTAAKVILAGGLVIYPTDTVYILAVDPTNTEAVKTLLSFKNRWTGKAISVAVTDKKMAEEYVELSETGQSIYANLLPGPFTIVSKGKHKMVSGIEAENGTLGVRIPDNKYVMDLIKMVKKPVTATSANLSGRSPHYSIKSFLNTLSQKKRSMVDLVVDAGKLPPNKPSTVIDATEPEIRVLRRGDLVTSSFKSLISNSESETTKIAEFVLSKVLNPPGPATAGPPSVTPEGKAIVLALTGDLGCGKTVFSRSIGQLLGVKEKVVSPTFVIYNEYKISYQLSVNSEQLKMFLHFDLYRLTDRYEFEEIKFMDNFVPGTISCIEWPENMGEEYLAKLKQRCFYVGIHFEYEDEHTRKISYSI